MSNISPKPDQQTSSETTLLTALNNLGISGPGEAIAKTGVNSFANVTAGGSGVTIGTTTITGGTDTRILYNNAGVIGEYTLTGTGTVVVMQTAPTFATSITGSYLTASEILITNGSKQIISAAVATYPSLTELTYIKGVTSAIQTQLNAKAATLSGTLNEIAYFNTTSTIASLTVATYPSLTEFAFVKGLNQTLATTSTPQFLRLGLGVAADSTLILTVSGTSAIRNGSGIGLLIGADDTGNTVTNSTDKTGRIAVPHYTNAEEPVGVFRLSSVAASSTLYIGGGTSLVNAVTSILFYQDNGTTTTTGTIRFSILAGETVVNDPGSARNFRIETDNLNDAVFIDGTNDRIGFNTPSPAAFIHAIRTTEQLRVGYDTSNYFSVTVGSSGGVTIDAVGAGALFTFSDGIAMGTNSITMTGSIAATGARVTKGWFTDIESTNMPTVGGTAILTSLTAPQFTTIELSHASANTLSASGGILSIESVAIPTISSSDTLSNKTLTAPIINAATMTGNFNYAAAPVADHSANGITISAYNLGATIALMDLVYLGSSSKWLLTDADAAATAGGVLLGICLDGGVDTDTTTIVLQGLVRDDTWNWTPGAPLYIDTTTPGQLTATQPSGTDDVIRVVGFAVTADVIYLNPSPDYTTHT